MRHLLCVLAMMLAASVAAQTYVTDDILADQTWTPAGSPYVIQDNISVTASAILTIQSSPSAGVTVAFDGHYELQTEASGRIVAEGNADHHVVFTSHAGSPSPGDWIWVEITGLQQSTFDYCTFEYGRSGVRAGNCDPLVTNCIIRNCDQEGVYCLSAAPLITQCDISGNRFGIFIDNTLDQDVPTINYCNIYDNSSRNLRVMNFPAPLTWINCENNWWGTDVESEIQLSISDNYDNPDLYAIVEYDPWLHEVPVEESSWGRVKALFLGHTHRGD